MTIWTDASHNVRQADASDPAAPVTIAGCTATLLTADQAAAFAAAEAIPNGGITFDGTTFGTLPVPPPPSPPAFALLPACGSGATGTVAPGTDDLLMAGTIHTGAGPAAGDILTVTFGTPRAAAPLGVQVFAQNVQAGVLIAKNITATGFTVSTTATPAASTTYTLVIVVHG